MLDGLDNIPWKALEHAYGSAEDVPGLLRKLLSTDPKVRSEVMKELYSNIYHQGTRFPATPCAIPFLIELCGNPSVIDRGELLQFWAALITGNLDIQTRPSWGDGTNIYSDGVPQTVNEDDPEVEPLHEIYNNSLAGEELLLILLNEEDISVRAAAAYVLACLPTIKRRTVPRLRSALLLESNPWVRAAMVFALGELGDCQSLEQVIDDLREHAAARCMAACELARVAPTERLISPLISFLSEPIDGYESVPGNGGTSTCDAAFAISYLPREVQQQAIPALCGCLPNAHMFAAVPIVSSLLSAAFEPCSEPVVTLTEVQRMVILNLLDHQELWSIGNLVWRFTSHGLPANREECAQLAGVRVVKDEALSLLNSAALFSQMDFLDKARTEFENAVELDPSVFGRIESPDKIWLYFAKAYAETDPARALKAFDNAVAINPRNASAVGPTWRLSDLLAGGQR